jgi:predicted enzyme related to lactoylglutathione lyase
MVQVRAGRQKLQDFYSGVFGWKIDASNPMNYGMVDNAGRASAAASQAATQTTSVTFYVEVDDPQAYLNKIESKGGKTVMPVTEVPGMVIFAQFADPEGNVVGITKRVTPRSCRSLGPG